jgi:hypothetical protein
VLGAAAKLPVDALRQNGAPTTCPFCQHSPPPTMSASLNSQAAKVFVSYSHRDNIESDGTPESGWIAAFVRDLDEALKQRAKADLWWDHRMPGNEPLTEGLSEKLKSSAALLSIVSPAYIQSQWCQSELEWFIQNHGNAAKQRIFAAEILPIEIPESLHPILADRKLSQFWNTFSDSKVPYVLNTRVSKDSDIQTYKKRIIELAHWLAMHINHQPAKTNQQLKVWIAPTIPDIHPYWEMLASALRQAGHEVLRTSKVEAAESDQELDEALGPALNGANVLVQLLGATPDRKRGTQSVPLDQGLHLQMSGAAQRCKVPLLVWRPPELQLPVVPDEAHRQLLTGTTACGFPEFIGLVKAALQPPKPASQAAHVPTEELTVCISSEEQDSALHKEVKGLLKELDVHPISVFEPDGAQALSQWLGYYGETLSNSHGLLVLYGQAPGSWVQSRLTATRKYAPRARLKCGLVVNAPPTKRDSVVETLSEDYALSLLDCSKGQRADLIAGFVQQLRSHARGTHV